MMKFILTKTQISYTSRRHGNHIIIKTVDTTLGPEEKMF